MLVVTICLKGYSIQQTNKEIREVQLPVDKVALLCTVESFNDTCRLNKYGLVVHEGESLPVERNPWSNGATVRRRPILICQKPERAD